MSASTNQFQQPVITNSNSSLGAAGGVGLATTTGDLDYNSSQKALKMFQPYLTTQQLQSGLQNGGFANRFLENNYNKSVFALIFLLQNTLLKFFDGEKCSQVEFMGVLEKLFGRMLTLESQKFCPPKFTKSISKLVKFLGVQINEESIARHESSIQRLRLKHDVLYESEQQQETTDLLSRSLEPVHGRFEHIDSSNQRINRFKDDQNVALGHSEETINLQKRSLRKKAQQTKPSVPKQKSPSRNTRNKSNRASQDSQDAQQQLPNKIHEPLPLDASNTILIEEEDTPRDGQLIKQLRTHDSIHTIKEDDFTKEDDTMLEESKEQQQRQTSSISPGYNQLKLDIPFSQIHSPDIQSPEMRSPPKTIDSKKKHPDGDSLFNPIVPAHQRSIEYNSKTIKVQSNLDAILTQAKRQYDKDKNQQSNYQALDYTDGLMHGFAGKKKKGKINESSSKKLVKLDTETASAKPIVLTAKRSPPAIRTLRPRIEQPQIIRGKAATNHKANRSLNNDYTTSNSNSIAAAAKRTGTDPQRSRKFLKNFRKRKNSQDHEASQESSQEEMEVLKQTILEQHLRNQQRIQDKRQEILAVSKEMSGSNIQGRGRAHLRKFIEKKMQRRANGSVEAIDDANNSSAEMTIQNKISKHQQRENAVSLDEGFKLKRRNLVMKGQQYHKRELRQSNPQIKGARQFKKLNLVYAAENSTSIPNRANQMLKSQQPGNEYFDDYWRGQKMWEHQQINGSEDRSRDSIEEYDWRNQDLVEMFPQQKKASQSLAVNSQNLSSQEDGDDVQNNPMYHSMQFPREAAAEISKQTRGITPEKQIQVLGLVPLPLKQIYRSRAKHHTNGDQDQFNRNRDLYDSHFPREIKRDSAYESQPSSGRWRQPAGGASAGVSDGANTFSVVTQKEAMSQMQPLRPGMMMNTLYSFNDKVKQKRQGVEKVPTPGTAEDVQASQNGVSQNGNIQGPIQRGRGHVMPDEIGLTEPSLPQFPSSMEAESVVQRPHENLIRFKTAKSAARATRAKISFQGTDEHISQRNTGNLKNDVQSSLPHSSIMKNTRKMQFSQNEAEPYSGMIPKISNHQRLHTRGDMGGKNEDLGSLKQNPMNRTMQDWTNKKKQLNAMESYDGSENNPIIDPGVQEYIISQQYKRQKVQTGYDRVSQNSLQDNREIFSEEDFCNPDYYKFRLPAFSKAHHDSLFEIQKQRLMQQRQIFEEKANERSSCHSLKSQSRFGTGNAEDQKSATKSSALMIISVGEEHYENHYATGLAGQEEAVAPDFSPYGNSIPTFNTNTKLRNKEEAKKEQQHTLDSLQNPLLVEENSHRQPVDHHQAEEQPKQDQRLIQQQSSGDILSKMQSDNAGAYETNEENRGTGPGGMKEPRLSQQVAALILEDDSEQDDGDVLGGDDILQEDIFDGRSDDQAKLEDQIGRRSIEEVKQSLKQQQRRSNRATARQADESMEHSAPDKELFEHSEQLNEGERGDTHHRIDTPPQQRNTHTLFADSPRIKKQSNKGETLSASSLQLLPNNDNRNVNDANEAIQAEVNEYADHQSQVNRSKDGPPQRNYKLQKLPENVISKVVLLDSKLRRQSQKSTIRHTPRGGHRSSADSVRQQKQQQLQQTKVDDGENNYVVYDDFQVTTTVAPKQPRHESQTKSKHMKHNSSCHSSKGLTRLNKQKSNMMTNSQNPRTNSQEHHTNTNNSSDAGSKERRVVYSIRRHSGSNRRSLQTNNSILPKSLNHSTESQRQHHQLQQNRETSKQRLSRISMERRQRKLVP